jgi:NAD(P)-dependent dehydrogenase (short-subunit alcohol dehydrogenase family)
VRRAGPIYCIKHSQAFRAPGGSVTVTSGTATERPHAGWALSVGGGGALMATLRTLALDLAPARVNCIAPGLVSTEMWAVRPIGLMS